MSRITWPLSPKIRLFKNTIVILVLPVVNAQMYHQSSGHEIHAKWMLKYHDCTILTYSQLTMDGKFKVHHFHLVPFNTNMSFK